jgi:hypothetical protein
VTGLVGILGRAEIQWKVKGLVQKSDVAINPRRATNSQEPEIKSYLIEVQREVMDVEDIPSNETRVFFHVDYLRW